MVRGSIVYSKAGHDKHSFQVVMSLDEKYAFVCDGKSRRLERPKKKNIIHLGATNTVLDEKFLQSNKSLKMAINSFRKGLDGSEKVVKRA